MAEINIIYKIMILKLLSKVDFPLTTTQITDFFLEKEYTDYFTIQQALFDLTETQMIVINNDLNITEYSLTENGERTLQLFAEKISPAMEKDMNLYFSMNKMQMKAENSLNAQYYSASGGSFLVHLKMSGEKNDLIDLTFSVGSEDLAKTICVNWKCHYEDVYEALFNTLVQ